MRTIDFFSLAHMQYIDKTLLTIRMSKYCSQINLMSIQIYKNILNQIIINYKTKMSNQKKNIMFYNFSNR